MFSGWVSSGPHPPPPQDTGRATGPRDVLDWPACLTNAEGPPLRHRSRSKPSRWRRCCPACRNHTPWSTLGLSARGKGRAKKRQVKKVRWNQNTTTRTVLFNIQQEMAGECNVLEKQTGVSSNTGRPTHRKTCYNGPEMSSLREVWCAYLYLAKGDLEAEAFVEVGVQSVLFDCCLLLLQPLALVLQHHFNEGIWQE